MLKNDYMKEVENSLKLIKEEIDKSIVNKEFTKAKEMINHDLKGIVGLDINTIDIFPFEGIIELISKDNQYNTEKYIAFAILMKLEGMIEDKLNNEDVKLNYYKKSLDGFYLAYEEDDELNKKYLEDAFDVCIELSKYDLNIEEDKKILEIYEKGSRFDKAEDTLFYMLQKTNNDGMIILYGMKFYNRLKKLDNEILIAGNLPMEEVEDGISELENRLGH